MQYAVDCERPEEGDPVGADYGASNDRPPWMKGLQEPSTRKRHCEEMPRSILGAGACILSTLLRYGLFSVRPVQLPDMTLSNGFTKHVTMHRRTVSNYLKTVTILSGILERMKTEKLSDCTSLTPSTL